VKEHTIYIAILVVVDRIDLFTYNVRMFTVIIFGVVSVLNHFRELRINFQFFQLESKKHACMYGVR
jgi:hypothetical protein